jgi:hypothetical protein
VARAFIGIRHKDFLILGRDVPENLRHRPGAIAVENNQTVALFSETLINSNQRFGGWALQKGARLFVDSFAEEVVPGGVADIELDCWIEFSQLDKVRLPEWAGLDGWPLREGYNQNQGNKQRGFQLV